MYRFRIALCIALASILPATSRSDERPPAPRADKDADGIVVHTLRSERQDGPTLVRVLVPDTLDPARKYPVVYVLPVEAGTESRYGDGLKEIARLGLHDKHRTICVAPTFSKLPWYADHPEDPRLRQESYFVEEVVPFVEKHYPAQADAAGRRLLGFSKSGFGAFSLILRHPETFGRAAAWDAPLALARPGRYGSGEIYGTQENFDRYRIFPLFEKQAEKFSKEPRLCLLGHCNFGDEHRAAHEAMERLKIAHVHRDEATKPHSWTSGWVAEGMRWLSE